ncbi:hypothetical protein MRX96_026039 [Rhipicephalus microplus]
MAAARSAHAHAIRRREVFVQHADDSGRTCGSSAGKRWPSSKWSSAATTGAEAPVSGRSLSAERGRLLVAEQQERGLWAVPCEAIRREEARCSGASPRPLPCTLGSRSEDRRLERVFLRRVVPALEYLSLLCFINSGAV